jgi:ribosomal protein S21
MTHVVVIGSNIESAIRAFKRRVEADGILAKVRFRLKTDPKPSVKRKAKARIAFKRKIRTAGRRQDSAQEGYVTFYRGGNGKARAR